MTLKVSFPSYVLQQREIELDEEDIFLLESLMAETLLFYAEYHEFRNSSSYSTPFEKITHTLCIKHGVNPLEKKERLPFLRALLSSVKDGK